jgi:hypothetical protein
MFKQASWRTDRKMLCSEQTVGLPVRGRSHEKILLRSERPSLFWGVTHRRFVVSYRRFGSAVRPSSGPTGCPATSDINYQYMWRNMSEWRRSHLQRWGSLQSRRMYSLQLPIRYRFDVWRSWDCPSLMYSCKYNQQDATSYNIIYYCQCSTCFRRFLRPSSGAQNCTYSIW